MAKVFMVGGAKGKRSVALWNDPLARKPDAGYVMDGGRMYVVASGFEAGETVWFAGPAGKRKNYEGERIRGVDRDEVLLGSVSITQPR